MSHSLGMVAAMDLEHLQRALFGRLKATDGAFSYELPAGTDPAEFASAIVWCKQFSHLFAVAPFEADQRAIGYRKSGLCKLG